MQLFQESLLHRFIAVRLPILIQILSQVISVFNHWGRLSWFMSFSPLWIRKISFSADPTRLEWNDDYERRVDLYLETGIMSSYCRRVDYNVHNFFSLLLSYLDWLLLDMPGLFLVALDDLGYRIQAMISLSSESKLRVIYLICVYGGTLVVITDEIWAEEHQNREENFGW